MQIYEIVNIRPCSMSEKEVIIKTALLSRFLVIVLQYVSNIIIPDHEADAYRYPKDELDGIPDHLIIHLFGGFLRWDAQQFMHIGRYGYTYEHTLAFFPLYPFLVRVIAVALSYFISFINLDSLILLVSISLNILCFVGSALCLYELSLLFMSKHLAYKTSILFCFNPSSVFFSAPYTETLFSYLTFKSMLNSVLLYKKFCDINQNLQFRDVILIIPIFFSTLTRSNGVLNIGFLVYALICLYVDKLKFNKRNVEKLFFTAKFVILATFSVCLCMLPFILFQIYSFQMYCKDFRIDLPVSVLEHNNVETFVLPGTFSKHNQSWCLKKIPLAYSYVQSQYWKVGFLQYYELKQIPNFVLAFPVVYILLWGALKYFKQFPKELTKLFNFKLLSKKSYREANFNPMLIVFVIHSTVLTIFCVLNIHVQVTTRMLCSASPVLYWFSAQCVPELTKEFLCKTFSYKRPLSLGHFVLTYFLSYFFVGTIMFCNFLPWT